jgi:hypothetical protein
MTPWPGSTCVTGSRLPSQPSTSYLMSPAWLRIQLSIRFLAGASDSMSLAWLRIQESDAFPDFPLAALAAASHSRNVEDDYAKNATMRQAFEGTIFVLVPSCANKQSGFAFYPPPNPGWVVSVR